MPALDRHKLAAARLWAATNHPYLAAALFASPIVAVDDLGGLQVDEWWRVYVDPVVVDASSVEALGSEMVHLTGHVLRDHANRARAIHLTGEEQGHWVDAADAEINDDLPAELVDAARLVQPDDLACRPGRFAEEYFREGQVRDDHHDCGSGAHGNPEPWDQGEPDSSGDGVSGEQGDLLRRQVAGEIMTQGDVPDSLRRWAADVLGGRVDWRAELAAELRRGVAEVIGAVDYTYARPSRRTSIAGDVVLPSMRRPTPEIAVVCDTSGSVTDDLLGEALAEVQTVLRMVGNRGLRILACDAAVHAASRITSVDQVDLLGGGGTDMAVGIEAAVEHRPRPQVIVVLTDGVSPWPSTPPPGVRVVVGLLGSNTADPPTWAHTVRIDDQAS